MSAAEVTLLNGMLSVVLRELDNIEDSEITSEEITRYQGICESQFQTGLEVYEVMAMPTRENVMILVIGVKQLPWYNPKTNTNSVADGACSD